MEITATMSPPFGTRMALWDEYDKFVGVDSFDMEGERGPQASRTHARAAAAAAAAEVPPPPPPIDSPTHHSNDEPTAFSAATRTWMCPVVHMTEHQLRVAEDHKKLVSFTGRELYQVTIDTVRRCRAD